MRKLLSIVLAMVLMLSMSVSAAAAIYLNHGSPTATFTVEVSATTAQTSMVKTALKNWNDTATDVNITLASSSDNTMSFDDFSETWYGLHTAYLSGGKYRNSDIQINTRTIKRDATNLTNFTVSTITHEFGHPLWLADNPSSTATSLMNHNRPRNTMTKPQTYDINNVNGKYRGQVISPSVEAKYRDAAICSGDYPWYSNMDELFNAADIVVKAKVISSKDETKIYKNIPYTISDFVITEVYKGSLLKGKNLQLKQIGGEIAGQMFVDLSVEEINSSKEYILYLNQYSNVPYSLVNPTQGAYVVEDGQAISNKNNQFTINPNIL